MTDNPTTVWNQVLSDLQREVPRASYETWFADTRPVQLKDHTLVVVVPDSFTKGGIERRYQSLVEQLASAACGREIYLSLQISEQSPDRSDPPQLGQSESPSLQTHSTLPLNPDYSFDRFIRGKNNHLAYAASIAAAEAPGKAYNPLFIHGSVGLGKTHLLQAVGNFIVSSNRSMTMLYTTSEQFAIELINAIRTNSTPSFREKYRRIDLLLLDDVQFLEGKEATEEELFHTFNELYGNEKQIVLSSDRSPEKLSRLQDRLVSRFRWGLVADIQPPDLETRIAILREKADNRGLVVEDAVLELIARRISSNVRTLEGALIRAIASNELAGMELTPKNLEKILPEEGKRAQLTINHIKEEVATQYHLKRHDLEGASRKKEISQARHMAIYLAREMTSSSFPAIGKQFGNRDHTTIMHSYMKIKKLIQEVPLFQSELHEIQEGLAAQFNPPAQA